MKIGSGLTRHQILKLVVLLYLGQLMLPVLFVRLPFPLNSYIFYNAMLLLSLFLMFPTSVLNRSLKWFYVFAAVHLTFRLLVWNHRTDGYAFNYSISTFVSTYMSLYAALLVYWHYISRKDYQTLGLICRIVFMLVAVSIINNLFIFIRYPNAMNIFTGRQGEISSQSFNAQLRAMGFIGYGFFNGLTSVVPVLVYMVKYVATALRKISWILLSAIFLITIPRTNTTAFLLFTIVFGAGAWFLGQNYKRDLARVLSVTLLIILVPNTFIASIFYKTSEYFPDSKIGLRLYDAGVTIEDPNIDYYQSTEHTGRRLGRIPLLWRSFLSNPLFGGNFYTGHVAWFDLLSVYGLIGFIPWFIFVFSNTRKTMLHMPAHYLPYYLLSTISFVAMGFLKNTGGSHVYTFWFLILPGSAYMYIGHHKKSVSTASSSVDESR